MQKEKRHRAILKIISENEVETQEELRERLKKKGISVGQSTLSRDMKELKIRKRPSENDVNCYYIGSKRQNIPYSSIFAQSVISMEAAQNIVVLKCHAGLAPAACKVVDEQNFDSVVGTIAGDDTVFIVTKSENFAEELIGRMRRLKTKY